MKQNCEVIQVLKLSYNGKLCVLHAQKNLWTLNVFYYEPNKLSKLNWKTSVNAGWFGLECDLKIKNSITALKSWIHWNQPFSPLCKEDNSVLLSTTQTINNIAWKVRILISHTKLESFKSSQSEKRDHSLGFQLTVADAETVLLNDFSFLKDISTCTLVDIPLWRDIRNLKIPQNKIYLNLSAVWGRRGILAYYIPLKMLLYYWGMKDPSAMDEK